MNMKPGKIVLPGVGEVNPNQPPPQIVSMIPGKGIVICSMLCATCLVEKKVQSPAFVVFDGKSACTDCIKAKIASNESESEQLCFPAEITDGS